MKTTMKLLALLSISLFLVYCSSDNNEAMDPDPVEANLSIVGEWEVTDDSAFENARYVYINEDNTLSIAFQEELGFRDRLNGIYSQDAENNQLTIDIFFGIQLTNYALTENELAINFSTMGQLGLRRTSSAPELNTWITELEILAEGDAPWTENADIAWTGTQILLGNGYEADDPGFVNPETFALEGTLSTPRAAFAIEVEKNDTDDKYIFLSNNGSANFQAIIANTGAEAFVSPTLGSWIMGMASVDFFQVWVSSDSAETLYLYEYATHTVRETIAVEGRRPEGLDYQNGFLYLCSQGNLYKCDVSGDFEVVETYTLPDYNISGVAFDGTNFWVNAQKDSQGKLVKLDLTL